MAVIRIVRNEAANCITFEGTSVPAYFNACLSGEISSLDPDKVNIRNDIRSNNQGEDFYEFSNIPYTDFEDRDGNTFNSAQECVDYITSQGNVLGLNSVGKNLAGTTVNFRLDQTSTSIIVDNGESFGVNTIKAVSEGGLIKIKSIGEGVPTDGDEPVDRVHFENLDHTLVKINDVYATGGLNDVVSKLNELFTVGAFEAVVIRDPYSTMVADVNGVASEYTLEGSTATDPTGDDIFTNSSSGNYAGLKSVSTINQAGEYFTFDIRGEGQIGFGLVHTQASYDDGYFSGNSNYADPTSFAVSNSAHYGFQYSHWFHPTPNGSWTNYGANTSYAQGEAWYNSNVHFEGRDEWLAGDPIKIKVGIDENGFIAISSLADDGVTWKLHARTTYPVPQGSEFHLGVKANNSSPRVYTEPKIHLLEEDDTPTSIGDTSIDIFGSATGTLAGGVTVSDSSGDNDGFISAEILDASGEYFEFEVNENEDHIIGLFSENDYDVATVQADTANWTKGKYMFFGGRINSNEQFTSNVYKNASGASIGSTALQRPLGCTHFRIGFDTQGRTTMWSSTDGVNFVPSLRHSTAAPSGDYKLIWVADSNGATFESLTSGLLTSAPVMNFRYIESPDGSFDFPLFATEEEANYYDLQEGGSGTSTQRQYSDDPTFATWYLPDTGGTIGGSSAPSGTEVFESNLINWTEITSFTNADLAPPTFTASDLNVNELSSVNHQTQPSDTLYTTTFNNLPSGLIDLGGGVIGGVAPEVTGDNVANPSDSYDIDVIRTNTYGSSTGTLTIVVSNLTAPTVDTGAWVVNTGTITSGVLQNDSTANLDITLDEGERIIIPKQWVDAHIDANSYSATTYESMLGVAQNGADFTDVSFADFEGCIRWFGYSDSNSHGVTLFDNLGGTTGSQFFSNSGANSVYDYGLELYNGNLYLIACNINSLNIEPAVAEGGNFSRTQNCGAISDGSLTAPLTITLGANGDVTIDLDDALTTSDVTKIDIPATPATGLTRWTKAVDFSGSNEHLTSPYGNNAIQPLRMNGDSSTVAEPSTSGYTSAASLSKPWATTVVFQRDSGGTNQHIWNQGEGAGDNDDNIYLRTDQFGALYFGWGRQGALNEYLISTNLGTSAWYGVYVGFNGTRLNSANATNSNLNAAFDIYLMFNSGGSWIFNPNPTFGGAGSWSTTGGRMDRSIEGNLTIGGRGNNRSFHGKVASFVQTTLERNVPMPDATEIEAMITNPIGWLNDYKVGNTYRQPATSQSYTNFALNDAASAYATQVWLMGDGIDDSYLNDIRNQVYPSESIYTKMNFLNMVSNDIENVNISGLS